MRTEAEKRWGQLFLAWEAANLGAFAYKLRVGCKGSAAVSLGKSLYLDLDPTVFNSAEEGNEEGKLDCGGSVDLRKQVISSLLHWSHAPSSRDMHA